jgi:hypothetical protein
MLSQPLPISAGVHRGLAISYAQCLAAEVTGDNMQTETTFFAPSHAVALYALGWRLERVLAGWLEQTPHPPITNSHDRLILILRYPSAVSPPLRTPPTG